MNLASGNITLGMFSLTEKRASGNFRERCLYSQWLTRISNLVMIKQRLVNARTADNVSPRTMPSKRNEWPLTQKRPKVLIRKTPLLSDAVVLNNQLDKSTLAHGGVHNVAFSD